MQCQRAVNLITLTKNKMEDLIKALGNNDRIESIIYNAFTKEWQIFYKDGLISDSIPSDLLIHSINHNLKYK